MVLNKFLWAAAACGLLILVMQLPVNAQSGTDKIVELLEKSGYPYTKVNEGVWEIAFTGKNLKDFSVRVLEADDLVLGICRLGDRKDVNLAPGFLLTMLELNDKLDSVKFAVSPEIVYVRAELHLRVVDQIEFKYMLEQLSGAVDEAYPQIKQFLQRPQTRGQRLEVRG